LPEVEEAEPQGKDHKAMISRTGVPYRWWVTAIIFSTLLLVTACAVVSGEVRSEAISGVPLQDLLAYSEQYRGQTVILGGYILETRHVDAGTVIEILQTPLRYGQEPGARDRSEGRFMVRHSAYLDPEVYRKDRMVTVAGSVSGVKASQDENLHLQYLVLQSREIYLWPERPDRYPYYGPWYDYPWYGYPPAYYYRRLRHWP
jgi:outer membrane lipoprotein